MPSIVARSPPGSRRLMGQVVSPAERKCDFTSNLNFITRSTVAVSPDRPIKLQTARSESVLSFEYSASTAEPGVVGIGAVVSGDDTVTTGIIRTNLEVQPSRRRAKAEEWLTRTVRQTTIKVTGNASTFRKGRRALLSLDITAKADPLPPGMTPAGTLEVCLEVAGGAAAPQRCTTSAIAFERDMRESVKLVVEVTGSDPISVVASISLAGSVDGHAIADFSEFRSATTDFRPVVAAIDRLNQGSRVVVAVVAALGGAGGLAILVAACRVAITRARSYAQRRRRGRGQEDSAGYI